MLEVETSYELIDHIWPQLAELAEPPGHEDEFFAAEGFAATVFDDRRNFPRRYLRERAILTADGVSTGCYTNDITRDGLGLICSRQLFPQDRVHVLLGSGERPELTVRWCRRLGERCYAVGCRRVAAG